MTTAQYLKQISTLKTKIEQKTVYIEELRSRAMAAGAVKYKTVAVQTSVSNGKLESLVTEYVELEMQAQMDILNFEKMRTKIIEQIQELPEEKYIKILFKRFVECKSFEIIADEMNYDVDYARTVNRRAMQQFEKKYLGEYLEVHTKSHKITQNHMEYRKPI